MITTRRIVAFDVSDVTLARLLGIPPGHGVVGVVWNAAEQRLRIYADGPDLPEVERGQAIPVIRPAASVADGVDWPRRIWNWGMGDSA